MKILIADDNAQNRYLLEQLLTGHGHQCVTASNGREALDRVQAEPFDAIIADILMPVMDGFQFCRELKADPAFAAIPFIFYSATYTEPGDIALGRQLGAAHYLIKPAEPQVILDALRHLSGAAEAGPAPVPEEVFLVQYNARLIHKLESKMVELERSNHNLLKTNLALSDEIGRRRQAEKAVRSTLELQRATLESTVDGILAVDADGRIIAWNRSFKQMWRLPDEESPLRAFADLVARLGPLTTEVLEWQVVAGGTEAETFDLITLTDARTFERYSRPLVAPGGRPGRVWTFRDITERRQAEDVRRSMQSQLFELQKMEALGVLAGGIAHDFNNILTAILGQTSLAASQLPDGHPVQDSLAVVTKAGNRATELVRQILTFSRHQETDCKPVRLEEVVREALQLMRSSLPAGVKVETDFAPGIPPVRADQTQLHQVLMNLATNADHAMDGRGTLQITLRAVEAPAEGPAELRPGRYAFLSVRDSGPGIDDRVMRRLFEPFFTTKPAGRGTGLGLAVVHGIITGFGGHIAVRSLPGQGADFQIYLPTTTGNVESVEATAAGALRLGHGELVLVAEDDVGVRDFVTALLRRLKYRVEACATAEEAVEKFSQRPQDFSLVLTDLSMPGMSGSQLAQELRSRRSDLPVIIMTGYFSSTELEQDRVAMHFELLLKPCSVETLSEAIYRVLNLNR